MKSRKPVQMAGGRPDNFQTPPEALDPLLPYLDKRWLIWEPSSGNGKLAGALNAAGFKTVASDREDGFLNHRPPSFDAIVTNPPYSIKERFLGRCYDLGKPFALLMPITVFDSHERRRLFHECGVQVIFPAGRINYETPNHAQRAREGKKSSAWFPPARKSDGQFSGNISDRKCSLRRENVEHKEGRFRGCGRSPEGD